MTKQLKVMPHQVKNGTNNTIIHLYEAPSDVSVDTILNPETWSAMGRYLKQKHIICVVWEDMSKELSMRVRSVKDGAIRLGLMGDVIYYENEAVAISKERDDYEVKWSGPKSKFRVKRNSDGEVLFTEIETKEEAEESLSAYLEAL